VSLSLAWRTFNRNPPDGPAHALRLLPDDRISKPGPSPLGLPAPATFNATTLTERTPAAAPHPPIDAGEGERTPRSHRGFWMTGSYLGAGSVSSFVLCAA
jgi:hypothetical protein